MTDAIKKKAEEYISRIERQEPNGSVLWVLRSNFGGNTFMGKTIEEVIEKHALSYAKALK